MAANVAEYSMRSSRLEAFSDGVIAIIITVMVLELKRPAGAEWAALAAAAPPFLGYVVSFVMLGIYWNNHHHMFQSVQSVSGSVLWANLHLLFWLSIVPYTTAWMGEQHFARLPVAVYGIDLLLCAIAYFFLTRALLSVHGKDSAFAKRLGSDAKGKASLLIYVIALACVWFVPYVSCALYVLVAAVWFIPDRRFEKKV